MASFQGNVRAVLMRRRGRRGIWHRSDETKPPTHHGGRGNIMDEGKRPWSSILDHMELLVCQVCQIVSPFLRRNRYILLSLAVSTSDRVFTLRSLFNTCHGYTIPGANSSDCIYNNTSSFLALVVIKFMIKAPQVMYWVFPSVAPCALTVYFPRIIGLLCGPRDSGIRIVESDRLAIWSWKNYWFLASSILNLLYLMNRLRPLWVRIRWFVLEPFLRHGFTMVSLLGRSEALGDMISMWEDITGNMAQKGEKR